MGTDIDLRPFDGRIVRIVASGSEKPETYEGKCEYFGEEYGEHILNRREDGLGILNFMFFRNDILSVSLLPLSDRPGDRFIDGFGDLEEIMLKDGRDGVEDVMTEEVDEHIHRLFNCIESHIRTGDWNGLPAEADVIEGIRSFPPTDPDLKTRADELISKLEKRAGKNG